MESDNHSLVEDGPTTTLPGLPEKPERPSDTDPQPSRNPEQAGLCDVTDDGIADGAAEPQPEESSLQDHGVDVEEAERPTRIEQEEATEFGIDDRGSATPTSAEDSDEGKQAELFVTDDDQQLTLTGEQAQNQCPFEGN